MKIEELRTKTEDQLKTLLGDLKKEAMNLRFQRTTGELENTSRIRAVRRDVAKINTLLKGGDTAPKAEKAAPKKAAAKKPAAKKTTKSKKDAA